MGMRQRLAEASARTARTNYPLLAEMETLANEIKDLLRKPAPPFDDENARRELTLLRRWIYCYHHRLVADEVFGRESWILAIRLRDRFKLTVEELQRFENEGGRPADREQLALTERLVSAIRRIDRMIADIEWLLRQMGLSDVYQKPV